MRLTKRLVRRLGLLGRAAPRGPDDLLITIVISTLNRAASLDRILTALPHLDDDNFEVIVVVGPCTDDTEQVVARHRHRVRIGRCAVAVLGVSRNIGVAMAAGDILAFTDDDAVPRPDWLRHLRRGYQDPSVVGVGGPVHDAVGGALQWHVCTCSRLGYVSTDTPPPHDGYAGPSADPYLYLSGCNMSFRRDALVAAGGFNEDLRSIFDDAEIAGRIHRTGGRLAVSDGVVDHHIDPSHIRSAARTISDPYNIVRDFTVFVLHSRSPEDDDAPAIAAASAKLDEWRNGATWRLTNGEITEPTHAEFIRRAEAGMHDGLAAGKGPRRAQAFRRQRHWSFKWFK